MSSLLPPELSAILRQTPELREAYLVGGCVRDWLLGVSNKDFDIEVFGVGYDRLVEALSRWGKTDLVGKSFGVVKVATPSGLAFDASIPRRDSKTGPGHKGFDIAFDPDITPKVAASRRDFTINSLMFHPRREEVLDFYGGVDDLKNRRLRHTSEAFTEDPLRVLRGMQFAARFALKAASETVALCRRIKSGYSELAVERVRDEWLKWAGKSTVPSAGLNFLAATEWIEHFPELNALRGVRQDPQWHPEGDVFIHTCHCCDALARLPGWQTADLESRITCMLAVLAHDFGKPATTQMAPKDGRMRIVSPGHEEAGGPIAERFLERIDTPNAIKDRVVPLVTNHLAHLQPITDRSVRRLAKRLEPETITGLCLVMTADSMGRPPRPATVPESVLELQAKAAALQVQQSAPKPILMGRHLVDLGVAPGPKLGNIVKQAYEAQLEGKFSDLNQAYTWLIEEADLALAPAAREKVRSVLNR
ncbi:MAG: polynucleotide adenylyltransferase [Verrucomicrobia bacterium]|nr:polynucleotide adenylyltransferase [Verrucomicrobiota bacterium]